MTDRSRPRAEKWIWIALGVGVIVFVSVIFYILQPFLVEPEVPAQPGVENVQVALAHAKTALARGDFARARGIAEFVLESEPDSTDALLLAGEAATRMGDTSAAVRHYLRVPPESGRAYATSRRAAGNVRLAEAKLSDAEDLFRDALAAEPDSPITHSRLALILGLEGRVWESLPHQFATLVEGHLDLQTLLILAAGGERSITNKTLVDQATAISPNDPALWMGNARVALSDGEIDKAHELISRVLEIAPHFLEAHAIFGQIAVESDDAQLVNKWIQGLPDDAAKHPDIWYQQGVWLAKTGKQDAAARCFWESVKLLPISQRASYRLAQQLVAINRSNEAKQLFEWSDQLDKIRQLLELIYVNRDLKQPDEKMMQLLVRAAELTESMGRRREAWAWYRVASSFAPDDLEIRKQLMRLNRERAQQAPMVLAEFLPTRNVDLSSLPLPDWSDLTKLQTASSADEFIVPKFTDMATAARIDFTYHNAEKPDVDGMMIYQQNGGAVVAFDYDVDGWPDLFLSQGCAWPPQENDTTYRDRLYRNLGNGQFMDVTAQAGLGDQRFSQGATAGDFDNDGFPDLYLCNIGGNRLYRNRGDGTFAEISESAEVVGNDWSTSCLIADLNGDGLPDMYVVNYLEGREPLETVCENQGHTRACSPLNFPGGQDRFYLNLGNGRFEDATSRAGFEIPDGKGLGLAAVDLHGTGRKSIYVSNDATANFLFVPDQNDPNHFEERALLSGVAYDRDGQAQGSMGIAIGDLDGDLLFDIFVTHFYDEWNTIYRQVADGFFADASREYGMDSQSIEKLAFGTEVLDYDLDSYPDLVVVNGHVDDFRYKNEPFWMQPQVFRNARRRGFEEVNGELIGEYFQGKYLGRALATLDWNRDGKLDFAVMHLQRPVALLTNETQTTHNSISLHLRGVQSERMAFGATITVTHDGRTTIHQLVAGGGYQCCNQTMLQFGLAAAEQAEQIVVRWPSGLEQVFESVPANREYLLVEGAAELAELPRD